MATVIISVLFKQLMDHGDGSLVRQPSVRQQQHFVKFAEDARRRLMDGTHDDFTGPRDAFQSVDDVCSRVAVQACGNLVAEQYRRVVQQLYG